MQQGRIAQNFRNADVLYVYVCEKSVTWREGVFSTRGGDDYFDQLDGWAFFVEPVLLSGPKEL